MITFLQWSPAVLSNLTIPAVFPLAIKLLGSSRRAALASGIYALTPQAFEWHVKGGGLTRALGAVFAILIMYFAIRTFQEMNRWMPIAFNLARENTLESLDRQAFAWVQEKTPENSRIVVLGWRNSPWVSTLTEWFPTLRQQTSLTTIQGREWLTGKQNVTPWIDVLESAQACIYQSSDCLSKWSVSYNQPYDYAILLSRHPGQAAGSSLGLHSISLSQLPKFMNLSMMKASLKTSD